METLLYTILIFPLIGFLFNGLIGKFLPKKLLGTLATSLIFGTFLMSGYLFTQFSSDSSAVVFKAFEWFSIGSFSVDFSFQIDQLSLMMILIITGIGTLIHCYSIGYMSDDKGFYKFFAYLNLFIFSMLMLVLGSNYLMLFIGWEGVGLCSFLLIGFWFENSEYEKAARKAFIMNRIGDLGMLVGIFMMVYHFNTLEYLEISDKVKNISPQVIGFITMSFFIGAMGKSAQIPLFTWLPDAMVGPTPVSALIHAATMVTAGIYLVVRSNFLYDLASFTTEFILWIGVLTSLLAGFIALRQNDIKKVLAYSTVSQLGFMFAVLGVGAYTTAMFHLMTHAFFKALLFLGSGSVIHAMGGEQDMRMMGGLKRKIPITYWTFLVGTLAICGIPPLSGMISKDEILMALYVENQWSWFLMMLSAGLTAMYMFRLLFLTFWGGFRGTKEQESHLHESPWTMTFPLIVLSILSIFGGFVNVPHFIAHGEFQFLAKWLHPILVKETEIVEISFWEEMGLMALTILMVLIIFSMAKKKYQNYSEQSFLEYKTWEKLSANKLFIDEFYQNIFVKGTEIFGQILSVFDRKILDKSVHFIGLGTRGLGKIFRKFQNGNVEVYLTIMTLAVAVILILIFYFKI